MIPFNKVHVTGDEVTYINKVMQGGHLAGDGPYTKACQDLFEKRYRFKKALLTSSCTDALELAAILIGIQPGDEVIMPSYSFSSTANAFILRGAKIVFADSNSTNPNIDVNTIAQLITPFTKAMVVVHYGGIACDMQALKKLVDKHDIFLVEDAAQAIDCFYKNKPLGSFGHLAAFSFHETKNITCGEGGLLVINDKKFLKRAEVLREKGTNRAAFMRKEIISYNWVDIGSSFLPSDITAAYLFAQLNALDDIMAQRRLIWAKYYKALTYLAEQGLITLPSMPGGCRHNGHIFYFLCENAKVRKAYIDHMQLNNVQVRSHYVELHNSPFYKKFHGKRALPMAKIYQDRLVRLPVFYDFTDSELNEVVKLTHTFFLKEDNV